MYVYQIIEAIKIAKQNGLTIPIIYNSNGYENLDTIKLLNGYIDVYLPDLKYYTNNLSKKYSNVDNYFEIATNAIKEMYDQVGNAKFDDTGLIKKGVIIRHLILPNHIQNSKNILKWISNSYESTAHKAATLSNIHLRIIRYIFLHKPISYRPQKPCSRP